MDIKCQLVERVSQKGNKYLRLEISLSENYKKIVFLDNAEVELIKLLANKR